MEKTKIDWCDSTWNPITGCKHGCPYCYAKGIVNRFASRKGCKLVEPETYRITTPDGSELYEVNKQAYFLDDKDSNCYMCAYPHGFIPTIHRYRMEEYKDKQKSRNIFVGSMTDVFAEYIPDRWRKELFNVCEAAPQHNYLFLTKNPAKYLELAKSGELPEGDHFWYGSTATTPDTKYFYDESYQYHTFLSIEPMLEDFGETTKYATLPEWIIIGAETGNRKDRVIPRREWIENIVDQCRKRNIPVFMKSSLLNIWGAELIREFPPELMNGR